MLAPRLRIGARKSLAEKDFSMFSTRIVAACSIAAVLFVPFVSAETFNFEPQPTVIGKGRDPQLAVRASGELFLLRVEGQDLWLETSNDGGDSFGEKVRVNDAGEVSSHAESTPQMIVRSMHEFYCLWELKDAQGRTSLHLSRSMDWGRTFGKSVAVDAGNTAKSQSFYSMAVTSKGVIVVAWLDGKGVSVARSVDHGRSFETPKRVAKDVCPCCRPALATGPHGEVYLSWRGMFPNDVRDMVVASSQDDGGSFSPGSRVAHDDWHIDGCPHAGDTMVVLNSRLFASWHTVRNNQRWLFVAWSDDHGQHFSQRINAAAGVLDADHAHFVSFGDTAGLVFQARPESGDAGWSKLHTYFRQVTGSGALLPLQDLGHASGSATYPVVTYEHPNHLFIAWTERSDTDAKVVMTRGRSLLENSSKGAGHGQ
jgi:hypothetical protein